MSVIGYTGGMGAKSHLTPGEYSMTFNAFLARVVEAQGGRPTERWAEANMPRERGRTYWGKLLAGTQAMTTEDIALLSRWLNVTPYVLVQAVRDMDIDAVLVSRPGEDEPSSMTSEEERNLRKSDQGLAAKRGKRK